MADIISQDELQKYGLSAESLLAKFKEQLLKDFEMSNVQMYLDPVDDLSYEAIHLNVSRALNKIIEKAHSNFQQLLYRIDISEKQYQDAVREHRDADKNSVLADLIIKRVLQKVILKLIYSK